MSNLDQNITKKIKLDFKESNMPLEEEKDLLQKFGLKKDQVKFTLMVLR